MKPCVTLITPVYNQAQYLEEYINCILEQTFRPLQVIFVDDGSSDGSGNILTTAAKEGSWDDISVEVITSEHRGQAHAMNMALPRVMGELLTWCDADDLMPPKSIEIKADYLLEHPEDDMVRTNGTVFNLDLGEETGEYASPEDKVRKKLFDELLYDRTYCYAGTYMIRTKLFFACYPNRQIPESTEGQNLQMLLPPASRSYCGYCDEKLHTYRVHSDSHSKRRRTYAEALLRTKNFTKLRLKLLEYCDCDVNRYTKEIMWIEKSSMKSLLKTAARKVREDSGDDIEKNSK